MTPAQVRLVETHLANVRAIARRVAPTLPRVELDDVIADGHLGLVQAALAFEPARGVPFHAFAAIRIHGAIIDGTRRFCRRLVDPVTPVPLSERIQRRLHEATTPEALAIATGDGRFLDRAIARCPNPVTRDVARGFRRGETFDTLSRRLRISRAWVAELRLDFLREARAVLRERAS